MRRAPWIAGGLFGVAVVLGLSAAPGFAQRAGGSSDIMGAPLEAREERLELEDVLESVQVHHPVLRAEIEAVQAALGDQLEARGAFDPSLSVSGSLGPAGYYDYDMLEANVSQLTPLWGAELYAGYRLQGENLPDYYGELETLGRGELRAGLRIPLWKDRAIDEARAGRRRTDASLEAAEQQRDVTLLELWRGAAMAYYKWSAALRDREVQSDLLALARIRVDQVRGKVESGALPPIEELDNRRALLSREAKLIEAQRKLEQSEVKLALYLRDAEGRMRPPTKLRPDPLELPEPPASFDDPEHIERALDSHPELERLAAEIRALQVSLRLAQNQVAPDLSVAGEVSKDFGDGTPDQLQRLSPAAVRLKATLKMPLALRKARGKRDSVAAKLRALEAKASFARDKLRAEVLRYASALRNAMERAKRTQEVAEVAERLAAGERSRFELGATTLIWVVTREKTAADARIDAIHAVADARIALAAYKTALAEKPL